MNLRKFDHIRFDLALMLIGAQMISFPGSQVARAASQAPDVTCSATNVQITKQITGTGVWQPPLYKWYYGVYEDFSWSCDAGNVNGCKLCWMVSLYYETVAIDRYGNLKYFWSEIDSTAGSPATAQLCGSTGNVVRLAAQNPALDPDTKYKFEIKMFVPGPGQGCPDGSGSQDFEVVGTHIFRTGPAPGGS